MSPTKPLTGIMPIAPMPFHPDGTIDLDGKRRVLDCMIDQGVDAICILANYSEQFLLSDDERDQILRVSMEHVRGRVPVIVTCSHFSTDIASARARRSAELGANMLMLMPPYHGTGLRADEQGMIEHFAAVAKASQLPIMVQDAPLSGVALSVPFLARLAREVPGVNYFKIEVPGTAAKLRALIAAGGDKILGPFDGEEGDHADGRSGCRRHRHHDERPHPRSDQAGGHELSRGPPRRGDAVYNRRAAADQLREPAMRSARHQDRHDGGRGDQVGLRPPSPDPARSRHPEGAAGTHP